MVRYPLLLVASFACVVAAVIWARSALRLQRSWRRLLEGSGSSGTMASGLARSAYRKEVHTTLLYTVVAVVCVGAAFVGAWTRLTMVLLLVPIAMTLVWGQRFLAEADLIEERASLERRAEEVLSQENLAPRRWAARLAPQDLPEFEGFEVGRAYEPGTGLMAGDFYDITPTGPQRVAAVIGDVSGHGIEPSITAFQVKYLLRVFLRQYRDPAQALEELNAVISAQTRNEEFVSLCLVVFDQAAGTLRYASAGHPPAWLWHDGEVRPLRSTGPLLTLNPKASYASREVALDHGDLLVLYTDGLAEARAGGQLFGEERIAAHIRRDPGVAADVLCKSLLAAARDFATGPIRDDVAILAVRRT
ncbi:MAG: Serine phosphatase RsbU, regulator of sigma subunit [uncultured Acidimicrobiales bacterium]|uniref:Serine phosphatase RsbU, regulator of sigma subunit n=1 Tax=uncultured Acidimicrobiales bacterium TaxID=310071 RepID=A0A6J4H4S1_9ACTN|nr:MAG: Serine phosphatase RsbU, regulator of sigma subunit [uncultured Acidimicrobiales bacterium]